MTDVFVLYDFCALGESLPVLCADAEALAHALLETTWLKKNFELPASIAFVPPL